MRSIEFYFEGVLIEVTVDMIEAYATDTHVSSGDYAPINAFVTSLSKVGGASEESWFSSELTSHQRLIVVFNNPITFDEVVINNYHSNGEYTNRGLKTVVITTSTDEITDITYKADIANSTPLTVSNWPEHIAENIIDDQTVWEV